MSTVLTVQLPAQRADCGLKDYMAVFEKSCPWSAGAIPPAATAHVHRCHREMPQAPSFWKLNSLGRHGNNSSLLKPKDCAPLAPLACLFHCNFVPHCKSPESLLPPTSVLSHLSAVCPPIIKSPSCLPTRTRRILKLPTLLQVGSTTKAEALQACTFKRYWRSSPPHPPLPAPCVLGPEVHRSHNQLRTVARSPIQTTDVPGSSSAPG